LFQPPHPSLIHAEKCLANLFPQFSCNFIAHIPNILLLSNLFSDVLNLASTFRRRVSHPYKTSKITVINSDVCKYDEKMRQSELDDRTHFASVFCFDGKSFLVRSIKHSYHMHNSLQIRVFQVLLDEAFMHPRIKIPRRKIVIQNC
jgi:hypothetical protein